MEQRLTLAVYWIAYNSDSKNDRVQCYNDVGEIQYDNHGGPLRFTIDVGYYEDPDSDTGLSRGWKVTIEYVWHGYEPPRDAYPTRYSFERVAERLLRVDYIDLTRVNNMSRMFYGCNNFVGFYYHPEENRHIFEIGHLVTDTSYMFCDCWRLRTSGTLNSNIDPNGELWLDIGQWNLDTRHVGNMKGMFKGIRSCSHIIIPDTFNTVSVTDMSEMFYGCDNCKSLALPDNFNTSNVVDMSRMFTLYHYDEEIETGNTGESFKPSGWAFSALESLRLSMFNTSKVECMDYMFAGLYNLNDLNIDGFDTSNVRSMDYMFTYCTSLEELDISGFNLENIESLNYTFARCDGLTTLNMNDVNASLLTHMKGLTFGCDGLTNLNMNNFNAPSLTSLGGLFRDCINLERIELDGFYAPNITNMAHLFEDLTKLEYVDASVLSTENVTDMSYMFKGCSALTSLDVSGFKTFNVTNMEHMFDGCSQVDAIDVSSFNMGNVKDIAYMFNDCNAITELDLSNVEPNEWLISLENLFAGCNNLTEIDLGGLHVQFNVTSTKRMFSECYNLRTITMCNLESDAITDTSFMFFGCNSLENIIGGALWTNNVTNMEHMFDGCFLLTEIPYITEYGAFDATSNVTNMAYMFNDCQSLTSMDISNFKTSNVENMSHMFAGCKQLAGINNGTFNTGKVTTMESMFEGCESLNYFPDEINNGLNYTNVRDMSKMFKDCKNLLNVPSFQHAPTSVETMESMFEGCRLIQYGDFGITSNDGVSFSKLLNLKNLYKDCVNLKHIDFRNLDISNISFDDKTNNMEGIFEGCSSVESIEMDRMNYGYDTVGMNRFQWLADHMRTQCVNVRELHLDNLKGEPLTSCQSLFKDLTQLESIYLEGFDLSKTKDMSYMFYNCSSLRDIDLTDFNQEYDKPYFNVLSMDSMFENCSSLCELNISALKTKSLRTANRMFKGCSSLFELVFAEEDDTDYNNFEWLVLANEMFSGCSNMAYLKIPNFNVRRIGATKDIKTNTFRNDMTDMFKGCSNLKSVALDNFKIDNEECPSADDYTRVTELGDARLETFFTELNAGAPNINNLELTNFDNYYLTTMKGMFKDFKNVKEIRLYNCNTSRITDMSEMFKGCSSLYMLNLSSFNTSKVTAMSEMFKGCSALSSLDLSSFDTRKVTTMESMFDSASALAHLNISSFDFTNVETLKKFLYFAGILTLDMSNFNTTGNATDMSSMFTACSKLTNLYNLDKLDTRSCTTMQMMFYGCSSLENLNVSNFNTSNVTSMANMFYGCSRLKTIDVSSFDTNNTKTFSDMFNGCSSLVELDLSNFRRSNAAGSSGNMYKQMFYNCSNLNKLDISGLIGYTRNAGDLRQTFDGCTCLEYLDISNFREAGDMLYNGTNVFNKFGIYSESGIINIGMLYMDTETCVLYAEKIWEDAISIDTTVNRINIYIQDADLDECCRLFYDDSKPSKEKIRFIPYEREEKTMYLPTTISSDSKLQWDEERREYYIVNQYGTMTPTGVKEKIKMETYDKAMFVDLQSDGKIQVAMKEKIEEESEK